MADNIGLPGTISIAVGGMVGGGIFAVLGVVAAGAGTAAWIAFTIAGLIALSAGYCSSKRARFRSSVVSSSSWSPSQCEYSASWSSNSSPQ
jgi:amino acid transporter